MIYIQVKSSTSQPHQSTCSSAETGTHDDEQNLSEVTFFVLICQNDDNYLHDDNDPMAPSVPSLLVLALLVFSYF